MARSLLSKSIRNSRLLKSSKLEQEQVFPSFSCSAIPLTLSPFDVGGFVYLERMYEVESRIESLGKARLLGHFEHDSAEWHAARAGIGGSDIGTILGVNPYKTRQMLLEERTGLSEGFLEPNLAMRLGTAFEPAIRRVWAEDNWTTQVTETGTWQSNENPLWKANPDGILKFSDGSLGILEIKNSMAREISQTWVCQVNWYMMLLGLNRAVLVQCKGNKLVEYQLDADLELQNQMRAAALQFERELQNGI